MLVIFKSGASANLTLLEKSGKCLIAALGKNPDDATGIITVAQLPGAIASLQSAMADKRGETCPSTEHDTADEPDDEISFSQRAVPLLDLLKESQKDGAAVTWGV